MEMCIRDRIRRISDDGLLSAKLIDKVIREQKPEKIRITLKEDKLRQYFPEEFTPKQIEDTIMELIANWANTRKMCIRDRTMDRLKWK